LSPDATDSRAHYLSFLITVTLKQAKSLVAVLDLPDFDSNALQGIIEKFRLPVFMRDRVCSRQIDDRGDFCLHHLFSSAFLLFLVQPPISKHILPWFGGSAAAWATSMVIFAWY